jgi:tetratricopeptide (TPR) repeat protein
MAYGMLTTLYSNRLGWRMTAEVAGEKAHEAIQQGLARSPEVTFFLGKLNMDIDLDYARAEANLREAEAQEPDNPTFLLNLGILSLLRGELNNAMNHLETAIGISASFDNGWARYHLGMAYMLAGMNTKALDQFEIARDSSIQEPPFNLIARCEVTYRVLGKAAADRCTDEGWLIYGEDRPDWLPGLFALTGRQAEARTILDDMERESAARDLALNSMAFEAYLHMGKMEDAYRWMGRAIENREPWMIMRLKSDQSLAPIREDVEFKNALARLAQIEAQGSPTRSAAMQ